MLRPTWQVLQEYQNHSSILRPLASHGMMSLKLNLLAQVHVTIWMPLATQSSSLITIPAGTAESKEVSVARDLK